MADNIVCNLISEVPVTYTLKLSESKNNEGYSLVFHSACELRNRYGGMDGYTYSFHDRTYRDVDSLWKTSLEQLSANVSIGTDIYGDKVLRTHENIPTFDSCDREWNSKQMRFLFYDGKNIHLVTMSGGYKIAQLTFYEKLTKADVRIKPVLEKLGWPIDTIDWL